MQSIYIPAELYMQLCYFLGKVYENFLGFMGVSLLVLGLDGLVLQDALEECSGRQRQAV